MYSVKPYAVSFPGSNSGATTYITLGTNFFTQPTSYDSFMVDFWIKPTESTANAYTSRLLGGFSGFFHIQYTTYERKLCVTYADSAEANNTTLTFTDPLSLNLWQHVGLRFVNINLSTPTLNFYHNGVLKQSVTTSHFMRPFGGGAIYVNKWAGISLFKGEMAHLRIWDKTGGDAFLQANWNRMITVPQSNLICYCPFDSAVDSTKFIDLVNNYATNENPAVITMVNTNPLVPIYSVNIGNAFYNVAIKDVKRINIRRDIAGALFPIKAGQCTLLLDNYSNSYTKTISYAGIFNNTYVTVTYAASTYRLFLGGVMDTRLSTNGKDYTALVTLQDALFWERKFTRENLPSSYSSVASLITQTMFTSGISSFDTTTLPTITIPNPYYDKGASLLETAQKLLQAGNFYGWLTYPASNVAQYVVRPSSYSINTEVVASYTTEFFSLAGYTDYDKRINEVSIRGEQRTRATSWHIVWVASNPAIYVAASSHVIMEAIFTDPITFEQYVPCQQILVVSHTAHLNSDGSGVDFSGQTTIIPAELRGQYAYLKLNNISPSTPCYFTNIQAKAYPTRLENIFSVSNSGFAGTTNDITLDNHFFQQQSYAESVANDIVKYNKNPATYVTVTQKNIYPDVINGVNLGDMIHVVNSQIDINGNFFVTSIEQDIVVQRGEETTLTIEAVKYSL